MKNSLPTLTTDTRDASASKKSRKDLNKLAKLQATLVGNYDSPTYSLTWVKCRATRGILVKLAIYVAWGR